MGIDHQHDDMMDASFAQGAEVATKKKFKKINILIFIACLVLAFAFWCYALHVSDPVIKRTLPVEIVLVGGAEGETVTASPSKIEVWGAQSVLGGLDKLTVKVNRSSISAPDKDIPVALTLPSGIESDIERINVRLTVVNTDNE